MLKAPPLHSSDLHLSVIKCNCRTYEDNISPKKMSFAILREYNMFDNKFDQYRTEVYTEIEINLFYCFKAFSNLFLNIFTPFSDLSWNTDKCRCEE